MKLPKIHKEKMTNAEKQKAAFNKLSALKVGALFMEMGSGKTKVALDLIAKARPHVDGVLYICPNSLRVDGTILRERDKWHPGLDLEVIGYEAISSSDRKYLEVLERAKRQKLFIVADESLKIKNISAKRTQRMLEISSCQQKMGGYRLIANGTPLSKNCLDIYSQMEFLSSRILNMSYRCFKDTFCEYFLHGEKKGLVKRQVNIPYLVSLIEPYIFDSRLDLNKSKQYIDYHYDLSGYIIDKYNEIKTKYLEKIDCNLEFDPLPMFQELQSCYTEEPEKQQTIDRILKYNPNEQFIIFVKYLKNLQGECISGSTSDKDKAAILEKFRCGDIRVLYMTYGVGSFGLNLQNCRNVIFADHTFDYAQRLQAEGRVFRIGQENNVNYYNIIAKCGLEKMIMRCLDKKIGLLSEVKWQIEMTAGGKAAWVSNI